MFKRRLAVLAAVATLAVTGLAGSALADEPLGPTAGAKVICKTSDGKTIELTKALPAEGAKPAGPDGATARVEPAKPAKPADAAAPVKPEYGETVEIQRAPAKGGKRSEGEVRRGVRADGGTWKAVPAVPAEGIMVRASEGPDKTVTITCKKAE
ncbi:hypothetical protein E1292_00085 [Nonomuraea deserti]|uniref:Uncharacterized protein n=1 Tax=Nonomuraea deserti TaxID=1848322 RepID=A0A4R4W495_9ACTN|nr:hypothetical protein [Nonomuraea deserti]TDD12711.1 hypothetical protein E1292_00085 [Nonomuraea deserti]